MEKVKVTVEALYVSPHRNEFGWFVCSALVNGCRMEMRYDYKPKNARARQDLIARYRKEVCPV